MQSLIERIEYIIDSECYGKATLFASRLGINSASVSMWRAGKSKPSGQTIQQICDIFGYSRDWLTTGEGEPRSLAAADQQIVDTLTHAMKYRTTNTDRFIRAVAAASNSPGGDQAIEATIHFLEQLLAQYRAQSPPDT